MRIHAAHYATGQKLELDCAEGLIRRIAPVNGTGTREGEAPAEPLTLRAAYVAPAFFDLQINGGLGRDFSSEKLTIDDIRVVVDECRRHGIGSLCPTLITNSFEALRHGMATLRQACESDADLAHALPAFHLEGPYISPDDGPRGAHPRAHVRPPEWAEFQRLQDAAGGRIKLLTLAPEHDGALAFIEKVAKSGVVVALGHTAASGQRIRDAVAAGARLSTHLGNGCHAMLPRHDNCVWEQLAADELWASVICDGHHLPPAVVRCIARVKTPARLILTCDASSLAGLPPGRYREWGTEIEVLPTKKIVVPALGVLAGSWAYTDLCIGTAMRFAGLSLKDAVDMATERPRQLLGQPPRWLDAGMPADMVLFDLDEQGDVQVRHTIVNGRVVR